MKSQYIILLSLVFAILILNSCFFSGSSIQNQQLKFKLRNSEQLFNTEWTIFETKYQPNYINEYEENYRKQVFQDNVEEIMRLNEESKGKTFYIINDFSDKTQEELENINDGLEIVEQDIQMEQYDTLEETQIALSIDWSKALPIRVRNQGKCQACWAMAAAQALEGLRAVQNGIIEEISVQYLVDCTYSEHDGCKRGNYNRAFEYTAKQGTISEEDYPFLGKSSKSCLKNLYTKLPFKNQGVKFVGGRHCNNLKILLQNGPVAVSLAASRKFMHYHSGILEDLESTKPNHAVILVGYTPNYWIIRNSWGDERGMKGYYHIKMGNHAQICTHVAAPTRDPQYTTENGVKSQRIY